LREALKVLDIDIKSTKASIQGFGKVGKYAAKLYQEYGGIVVAVSCWDIDDKKSYTFKNENGIDIHALERISNGFGTINKDKAVNELGCEVLEGEEWIKQDVDILMPCALENQITTETLKHVSKRVKVICEGANGPTSTEADEIIQKKKIFMIPDFLCNAGGVTCSYFEQVQCNTNYYWPLKEVLEKLDRKMTEAFHEVYNLAVKKDLYMRDAAYGIAIKRVADAVKMRGWV
jgi:glutamate dehydrogenase